jgi:hypothetical protein
MRRSGVGLIGLWIALVLLIAVMRQIGPWIDPPVVSARDLQTPGNYSVEPYVALGDVIAALGPPETLSEGTALQDVYLEVNFTTLHLLLFVKSGRDSNRCVRVRPGDEVQILAVWSADQPPSGKVYYPQVQSWAGFTRYCFR